MIGRTDKLVSAALRHVRDAEHLLGTGLHQSIDQAMHLAGFGPECIRKACLESGWLDRALGHGTYQLSDLVLELAIALDPHAWRRGLSGWRVRYPALDRWDTNVRYERTGATLEPEARAVLEASRAAVDDTLVELLMDNAMSQGAVT